MSLALQPVNERYTKLLSSLSVGLNQATSKLTEETKAKLLAVIEDNYVRLEAKDLTGYMRKLQLYEVDITVPTEFEAMFLKLNFTNLKNLKNKALLCKNMYYGLVNSFVKPVTGEKYEAIVSRNLLIYSTALLTSSFPMLTVEELAVPIDAVFSKPENATTLQFGQRVFNKPEYTSDMDEELRKCAAYYFIYLSILHFRKHGIYNIAIGQSKVDKLFKVVDFQKQFDNIYNSTNDKKYALLNLRGLDEYVLRDQYFSEILTLDCLVLICMQTGLRDTTLKTYNSQYLIELDSLIADDTSYNYRCGSLDLAFSICIVFFTHFIQALPEYTFKNEDGQPSGLNQFYSIRDAVKSLLRIFNTDKGFSKALKTILNYLEALFVKYRDLIRLYHEGHPNFVSSGLAAREIWEKVIVFVSTLGKAYDLAIDKSTNEVQRAPKMNQNSYMSWTAKPLFRDADVSALEVESYAQAMMEVLSKDNKAAYNQFSVSMAISSDMGNFNISPLNISDLAQKQLSVDMQQQPSAQRNQSYYNTPQIGYTQTRDSYTDL